MILDYLVRKYSEVSLGFAKLLVMLQILGWKLENILILPAAPCKEMKHRMDIEININHENINNDVLF